METMLQDRHAFLFQGVGAEYQKLITRFDKEQLEILNYYCSVVRHELNMDLWNYLFNAAETSHDKMFTDWIAIYTCDYIVYQRYRSLGMEPAILLGYSMGLITAMACGKSISFEAGLHMLLTIYQYPKLANREDEAMAVIVGLTCHDVEEIIRENNLLGQVEIGSENNEYCIVISGMEAAVNMVMGLSEIKGALKVKEVNAPYAFHSQFAAKGIEPFVKFVSELDVYDCEIPIISSFDHSILQKSPDLQRELIKNMTGRMYWKTAIEKIAAMGIESFIEVSLDDSVVKFSKTINLDWTFLNYNKIKRLKKNFSPLAPEVIVKNA
ncbi:ACP S-malonyltransferase [Alkaliphilus crotonatoxidans]